MNLCNCYSKLKRGDLVEVRTKEEILDTLDNRGTLDGLPFMPEMLEFCGKRFRVSRRAEQICTDGTPVPAGESRVRGFAKDDVFLLENLRCSGIHHAGCQRGCAILWKQAWLRRASPSDSAPQSSPGVCETVQSCLNTSVSTGVFFCQSSEILTATRRLSRLERVANCIRGILNRNYKPVEMLKMLAVWVGWNLRKRLFGRWPRGVQSCTPVESLNLKAGELVRVRPLKEILETLDRNGKNRGLHFSPDMALLCGQEAQVRGRVDKFISDGTGKMRRLRNTVVLEGAVCDSAYYAFGGCPRGDFQYWREIWLQRVQPRDPGPTESIPPAWHVELRPEQLMASKRESAVTGTRSH